MKQNKKYKDYIHYLIIIFDVAYHLYFCDLKLVYDIKLKSKSMK